VGITWTGQFAEQAQQKKREALNKTSEGPLPSRNLMTEGKKFSPRISGGLLGKRKSPATKKEEEGRLKRSRRVRKGREKDRAHPLRLVGVKA